MNALGMMGLFSHLRKLHLLWCDAMSGGLRQSRSHHLLLGPSNIEAMCGKTTLFLSCSLSCKNTCWGLVLHVMQGAPKRAGLSVQRRACRIVSLRPIVFNRNTRFKSCQKKRFPEVVNKIHEKNWKNIYRQNVRWQTNNIRQMLREKTSKTMMRYESLSM